MAHRPPPFGALRSVVPVLQSEKRGPWRLTLTSLEIWDTCWAANVDLDRDPLAPGEEHLSPYLNLDAFGAGGQRYVSGFGGGYGGGRLDDGQTHRQLVPFAQAIDPSVEPVRLEARLHLLRPDSGSPSLASTAWEDPEPWTFVVSWTGSNGRLPAAHPVPPAPRPQVAPPPGCSPEIGDPVRVVPVVAERTIGHWTVTIVSAEVRTYGVLLVYRLLGRDPRDQDGGLPSLHLRFTDEQDHEFPSWSGGGCGIPDPRGTHWRATHEAAVPPGRPEIFISVIEIVRETIEPDPDHPGMARLVGAERFPIGWAVTVPLG